MLTTGWRCGVYWPLSGHSPGRGAFRGCLVWPGLLHTGRSSVDRRLPEMRGSGGSWTTDWLVSRTGGIGAEGAIRPVSSVEASWTGGRLRIYLWLVVFDLEHRKSVGDWLSLLYSWARRVTCTLRPWLKRPEQPVTLCRGLSAWSTSAYSMYIIAPNGIAKWSELTTEFLAVQAEAGNPDKG